MPRMPWKPPSPNRGPPFRRRHGAKAYIFPHNKAISALLFHQLLARILALLDENDNAISRSKPRQLVALFGPEEAKQCR
jgi:hypothetical protein